MARYASTRTDDRPAMQFYVRDWIGDNALRMCSFGARGLWIDMLCRMWIEPERGTLTADPVELSRLLGGDAQEIASLLQELVDRGVASWWIDGTLRPLHEDHPAGARICCRRMWRVFHSERSTSEKRAQAGRKGGKQNEAKRSKQEANGEQNETRKPQQKEDLRKSNEAKAKQNSPPSSSIASSSSSSTADRDRSGSASCTAGKVGDILGRLGTGTLGHAPATLSDEELIALCARYEREHTPESARRLWASRLKLLRAVHGGRDCLIEALEHVANAGNEAKGVGSLDNPAGYLNEVTHNFLSKANARAAS